MLVWRHLRKLGAVHIESGVWLLPHLPSLTPSVEKLVDEIKTLGGKANAFYVGDLPAGQEEELRTAFNGVRREEYVDLLQICQRFLDHVKRVTEAGDFRFVQVEELEEDLEKRRRWLSQVVARDVLGVPERQQVEDCLKDCEKALAQFEERASLEG
ncbi:MAG: hypothetical protein GEU75_10005 [Dehalococcoidia bacterium]|nr:hypothetical protein [Dehalococcoidia bacterium]